MSGIATAGILAGGALGGVAGAASIGGLGVGSGLLLGAGLGGALAPSLFGGGGGAGQTATAVPTGLSSPFLGQTLGMGIRASGTRGVKFSRGTAKRVGRVADAIQSGQFGDPLFGPATQGAADFARQMRTQAIPLLGPAQSRAINEFLLQPVPLTNVELGALGLAGVDLPQGTTFGPGMGRPDASLLPGLFRDPFERALAANETLLGAGTPVLESLIQTGLPVDIDPIARAAQQRFREDLLPEISERFNVSRFGTGFQNVAQREARRIQEELGALDFEAQEAARQRQMAALSQTLPVFQAAQAAGAALPITFLTDVLGFGTGLREELEGQRPGSRLLPFLERQPQDIITRGVRPTSSTGDVLNALASVAPFLAMGLGGGGAGAGAAAATGGAQVGQAGVGAFSPF